MKKNDIVTELNVNNNIIGIMRVNKIDYISITDLAKYINADDPSGVIRNWMSNQNSFAFYSLWEEINNPDFNSVKSHGIKMNEVPYNRFTMTPNRWKKDFNAIGIKFQVVEGTVKVLMHILILLLNLQAGCLQNSNCI